MFVGTGTRDCKQKPTHDGKEKIPGNKGTKGAKSGKKNDGKGGKDKGDGKNEVGKANVALTQPEAGSSSNYQGHEAPLVSMILFSGSDFGSLPDCESLPIFPEDAMVLI